MKKIIEGWVGKTVNEKNLYLFDYDGVFGINYEIFIDKGEEYQYKKEDWPPKKVRITIEVDYED